MKEGKGKVITVQQEEGETETTNSQYPNECDKVLRGKYGLSHFTTQAKMKEGKGK